MPANFGVLRQELSLTTMQVADWNGPIVEVLFHHPITSAADVDCLLRETRAFMDTHIAPRGSPKAYFLTCYDGFTASRENLRHLQDAFLAFNREYSRGDARYGGSVVAQTLVISTAIRADARAEIYATRAEALAHLRECHREALPHKR